MKKLIYSLLSIALAAGVLSCEDPALDPMQLDSIKKGTILALRGDQLNNIYFDGLPGAELFPRIIDGTETFDFDAEFLAEDPSTLESFDIYVIKQGGATPERILLRNVPASEFKQTDDYVRPWVSVSIKLTDILAKLGLSDYTDPAVVDELLTTYEFGINIESDLNLTDGSTIPAAEIVAAGLFESDQFYPAQKLIYTVTDFCPYVDDWEATYDANEVLEDEVIGPYDVTLTQDLANPEKYTMDNFLDDGLTAYMIFDVATSNPSEQVVVIPEQTVNAIKLSGEGVYDQCNGTISIAVTYGDDEFVYEFAKQ